MMVTDGQLAGKIAVVADAPGLVGQTLVHCLATAGARVVLIGLHDGKLLDIAQVYPSAIETISLARGRSTVLATLGQAWESEPIDYYIDLLPFSDPGHDHPGEAIARSAGVLSALEAGLRDRAGIGVLALPEAAASGGPAVSAFRSLIADQASKVEPACLIGLVVRDMPDTNSSDTVDVLTRRLLQLVRDDRPRLHNGAVYEWSPVSHGSAQSGDDQEDGQ